MNERWQQVREGQKGKGNPSEETVLRETNGQLHQMHLLGRIIYELGINHSFSQCESLWAWQ